MIFLLQQFHGGIVEQPHPFVGLGCGSNQREERAQSAGRAKSQMNTHVGDFHRSFASVIKGIQGAGRVQIDLKFHLKSQM
jgi:hypothetical protein